MQEDDCSGNILLSSPRMETVQKPCPCTLFSLKYKKAPTFAPYIDFNYQKQDIRGIAVILKEVINVEQLFQMEPQFFPDKVKFCLDLKRRVVSVLEEMHTDMEYELYDDGSNMSDIYGGNIMKAPISVIWEAHPNIERNRELGIGSGRLITDETIKDQLMEVLTNWIR